jgi:CIC family chloride channel protein
MRDYIATHQRRRRVMPRALLVGLLAGGVATVYRLCLESANDARNALFAWAHTFPFGGVIVPMAFCALTACLSVWVVRRFAPEASGSGIPQVEAVLHRMQGIRWKRILPVKFVGGVLAMNGGLALGREGPTVQMGASVGQMVSSWFHHRGQERRTLIAAGAAAGLAAAFNAPLAGLVFVVEELQRDFATGVFTAAFMSAVSADLVVRIVTGQLPVFRLKAPDVPALQCLPVFIAIGLVCGLLGVAFNRCLLASLTAFRRMRKWPAGSTGALVGLGIGLIGWFQPILLGDGHRLLEGALTHSWTLYTLIGSFVVRFWMTMGSYGCGAPGGIFAPLLVLGAQTGLAVGTIAVYFAPSMSCDSTTFAVVGMAAYFTAIVRAPLTGIVLLVEMTGNYSLMLALLTGCLAAYAVADLLGDTPIYEALLERLMMRGEANAPLRETVLVEAALRPGARFSGKTLRELKLPEGCLLVSLRRGVEDLVPTAGTLLREGDRITAAIGPQASDAFEILKAGTDPDYHPVHHVHATERPATSPP